jgi:hypothetical protein
MDNNGGLPMKNIKSFSRAVRQEISRISITIKQMEFKIMRFKGFLKHKLREEVQELRRMRDTILHRLSQLTTETRPAMQYIRNDIALLHERCRRFKTQHL